jgi:hypothetical protein
VVRAGLRKEHIKSIIVTKDREFKRKAITFLNGSAFAAEKFTVEELSEGLSIIDRDLDCMNLVFDATPLNTEDLKKQLNLYQTRCKVPELRVLVYLDESYQAKDKDLISKTLPRAQAFFMPMAQSHFNKVFHGQKVIPDPPKGLPVPAPEEEAAESSPKRASKPSLTLIETSAHIKETVDMLNAVSKDKSRIETVRMIGQKFNGLIGAFAFFGHSTGYPKLRELAVIIDDISRTYRVDETLKITEDHWEMMMESAKCLYLILKDMREGRPPAPAYIRKADSLISMYKVADDIDKREAQTQEEIDQLIAEEMLKRSS